MEADAHARAPAQRLVFVHGLWMHGIVFAPMRRRLADHGHPGVAFSYPSVRRGLDDNTTLLAAFVEALRPSGPVDLIGHSLGGLLALRMMALRPDLALGRVVLMGAPVQGSQAARELLRRLPVKALIGPSIRDWLAIAPPRWPLTAETGVIAGSRSLGIARLLPGVPRPNDGLVSIAETELAGAVDRTTLHCSHSEMLFSRRAAEAAAHFLRLGRFPPAS